MIRVMSAIAVLSLICGAASAEEYSKKPDRSLYVGFDMGAGLDFRTDSRFPTDRYGVKNPDPDQLSNPEAYSLGSFLFGMYVGFRLNENFGLETGWHEEQHNAPWQWGGMATYSLGHFALRFAVPFYSRQTLAFRIGPAIGGFDYGESSERWMSKNTTYFTTGGLLGITLEHELTLGVVTSLSFTYLPMVRVGGDRTLTLCMYVPPGESDSYGECPVDEPYKYYKGEKRFDWVLGGEKDFSSNQFVQIFWISLGLQFEWIFR